MESFKWNGVHSESSQDDRESSFSQIMDVVIKESNPIRENLAALDEQIKSLKEWIIKAGEALMGFYKEGTHTFWQNTTETIACHNKYQNIDHSKYIHPTCTYRAFFATYEYLRFLDEEDLLEKKINEGKIEECSCIYDVATHYILKNLKRVEKEKCDLRYSQVAEGANSFTDSLLVISFSLLKNLQRLASKLLLRLPDKTDFSKVRKQIQDFEKEMQKIQGFEKKIKKIADSRIKELFNSEKKGIFIPSQSSDPEQNQYHDFLTLFVFRGLEVFYANNDIKLEFDSSNRDMYELQERVRDDILKLIAYNAAGMNSHFDATVLAFSTVLLNRLTPNNVKITECALDAIKRAQGEDGGWATPRRVSSYSNLGLRLIPSYEVALALTDLLISRLYDQNVQFFDQLNLILAKAFELVKSHYKMLNASKSNTAQICAPYMGWSNDHIRHHDLLESWSTSIVLTFLIHYHDALCYLRQHLVLKQYNVQYPEKSKRAKTWPSIYNWADLIPAFRHLEHYDEKTLKQIEKIDPTKERQLHQSLATYIIQPIQDNWIHRPQKDHVSLIFYGSPGTGKTTLSWRIAEALQWPFLILSPPDFLRKRGMEGIEASAAEIFDDLSRLKRAVVLFDECEDFFRVRPHEQKLESRTIGAFITSGMLPRLQNLHDSRWVIFILATNTSLSDLDQAVRRPGRFDVSEEIGYPERTPLCMYIEARFPNTRSEQQEKGKIIKDVVFARYERSKKESEHDKKEDIKYITFKILAKLLNEIDSVDPRYDPSNPNCSVEVSAVLERLLDEAQYGPPALTQEAKK